jgi:hypothetical protein
MPGREQHEASEANYYDGILSPNQADRMISVVEDGQVLKPLDTKTQEQRVGELIEDVRWPVGSRKASRKW